MTRVYGKDPTFMDKVNDLSEGQLVFMGFVIAFFTIFSLLSLIEAFR